MTILNPCVRCGEVPGDPRAVERKGERPLMQPRSSLVQFSATWWQVFSAIELAAILDPAIRKAQVGQNAQTRRVIVRSRQPKLRPLRLGAQLISAAALPQTGTSRSRRGAVFVLMFALKIAGREPKTKNAPTFGSCSGVFPVCLPGEQNGGLFPVAPPEHARQVF